MPSPASQRIDKWLWFARITKTRTLATQLVTSGKVRVDRQRVIKPSRMVQPGEVVTIVVHGRVRVLKVLDPGTRRGPASEAQSLYEDLSPPPPPRSKRAVMPAPAAHREKGTGRPTKRDRRRIDAWNRPPAGRSE